MSSQLSVWQEFALIALALFALSYAVLFRIWSFEALASDLVFSAALALLVAAIAFPTVFDKAGARIVEWSPLPRTLGEADERAADLAALPGRLIDGLLERIGFDRDVEAPSEEATAIEAKTGETGWLSTHVRPSVDGLVALLLRIATATIGGLVLVLALLLRIVTGLVRRLRRIGERLEALEASRRSADDEDRSLGTEAG